MNEVLWWLMMAIVGLLAIGMMFVFVLRALHLRRLKKAKMTHTSDFPTEHSEFMDR